jgi:hypothetical protein
MVETIPICGHYHLVSKNFHEQVKGAATAAPLLFSVLLAFWCQQKIKY